MLDSMAHHQNVLSGYAKLQGTRPQTLGYSLADTPVGQAAWIRALFQDVSDDGGDAERFRSRTCRSIGLAIRHSHSQRYVGYQ